MTKWSDGYVSDHSYGNYYFRQLAPSYLKGTLLLSGFLSSSLKNNETFRYLELGFGQGLSLNIHAGVDQEGEYWGTDFLKEQVLNAERLSQEGQLGTHLLNFSFEELAAKTKQLPSFDMIVMHGIWSWINDENRRYILDIIQKTLKPGGCVYLCYNAFPGRINIEPMRHLFDLYSQQKGKNKESNQIAGEVTQFVSSLIDADALYFEDERLKKQIKDICKSDITYIAHEYLNQNWKSFYFSEVIDDFAKINCYYATSVMKMQSTDISQPQDTLPFIKQIDSPFVKEAFRDFNLNRGFRADLLIKEAQKVPKEEYEKNLRQAYFALTRPLESLSEMHVDLLSSDATLNQDVYRPIVQAFAENNYQPKSFHELEGKMQEMTFDDLFFCLNMLYAGNYIALANPSPNAKSLLACQRLNHVLCEKTKAGDKQNYLASPVLGYGISVQEVFQYFLLAIYDGKKEGEWIDYVHRLLEQENKQFSIQTPSGLIKGTDAIKEQMRIFKKTLSFYKAVGIVN